MVNIDVAEWARAIIVVGAVAAATAVIWKQWLRPIVRAFQGFFEQHARLVAAVEQELPKFNAIAERFGESITDHESRIAHLEGAVGVPIGGGVGDPAATFMRKGE